jgi:hypothetical protein
MRPFSIVFAIALASACSSGGTHVDDQSPTGIVGQSSKDLTGASGLSQTVTVEPSQPAALTNVTIRSVLTNRGTSPVVVESRICGLNYAGTLVLSHPPEVMKCAGYSMSGTIAPGDSVVTSDLMRVMSRAGSFTLRVQHALKPEGFVDVAVKVR